MVVDPAEQESGQMVFTAPGKTILFGEHSVVYGRLAVAGAIGLQTKVELKFRPPAATNGIDDQIEITMPDLNFTRCFPRKKLLEAADRLAQQCLEENEPLDLPPSPEFAFPLAQSLAGPFPNDNKGKHSQMPANIAILTFLYVTLGVLSRRRDLPVFKIVVSSNVPIRVGLGSSGAFCVTLCASLLRLANLIDVPRVGSDASGETWDEEDLHTIERWATAAESLIHGRSSGLDACICARGGIITYRVGEYPQPLNAAVDLRVVIVNTKVERNTQQMIRTVKDAMEKFPHVINHIFDSIDEISKEAARILTAQPLNSSKSASSSPMSLKKSSSAANNGDAASLMDAPLCNGNGNGVNGGSVEQLTNGIDALKAGFTEHGFENLQELCRINNNLLNALGVGHAKITQICSLLARYGIHAKLSGAGGGGTAFAFITKDASPTLLQMITDELHKQGFELWQPDLGGPGVQQVQ